MQLYQVLSKIRFKGATGRQTIEAGNIISFEPADKVNIDFLEHIGAIKKYNPPVVEEVPAEVKGVKRGKSR